VHAGWIGACRASLEHSQLNTRPLAPRDLLIPIDSAGNPDGLDEVPHKNTTRDAFLIALQERNTAPEEPVRIAFEFNIGRRSGQNKNNIRLEGGKGKPITVRCRGSFNLYGFRLKSDDFFDFLDRKNLVQDSPGITLEKVGGKRFANLITLDGADVSGSWPELVRRLSWFAQAVWDFKTDPDRPRPLR
jgi:hypothetical protein